jgi:hypothetical protein
MQREITLLASTLGQRFHGDPVQAADAIGLRIIRRRSDTLTAAYRPGDRPAVVLAPTELATGWVALGLAHHLLRHRAYPAYAYTKEGPAYPDTIAWREARLFALEFLKQPRKQIAFRRHHAA